MFGLFDSKPFDDPQLGRFVRPGGRWKGECALPGFGKCAIVVAGSGKRPDESNLLLAKELPARIHELIPPIEAALLEHGSTDPEASEALKKMPGGIWANVSVERILFESMHGVPTIEIALRVAWDEEHTLGARIQKWQLTELNGSILLD